MSASLSRTQAEFLTRYLRMPASGQAEGAAGMTAGASPLATWRASKDEIDARISNLTKAMKNHGHPVYRSLAEFGLGGILDGQQTRLVAALMEFESMSGDDRAKAAQKVAKAVEGFRAFLDQRKAIDLMDQNPFGVRMDLRSTLEVAFDDIKAAAKKAA